MGFCFTLSDFGLPVASLYVAVCGRRHPRWPNAWRGRRALMKHISEVPARGMARERRTGSLRPSAITVVGPPASDHEL